MNTRFHLFSACCLLAALAGCTPNPNVPEPPPPPPMATPMPVEPVVVPTVNPIPSTVDPDKPITPPPAVDPSPAPVASVDELIAQLASDKDRDAAATSLAAKGNEAIPALTKALDHETWQVRAAAVFSLGKIGGEANAVMGKLKAMAEKDDNEQVRVAAAFALDALEEGAKK